MVEIHLQCPRACLKMHRKAPIKGAKVPEKMGKRKGVGGGAREKGNVDNFPMQLSPVNQPRDKL